MGRPENPLDPDAGPVQRFAVELRALRARAGGPTYRAMAQRTPYSAPALSQAAAGERLPTLAVALAYVTACGGDLAEWEKRWRDVADELAAVPREEEDTRESPYRGLARFEPDDAAVFFGREQLVEDLTELVRRHRCAVVLGPSGSGKSSLLRAGLIPRLRSTTDTGGRPAAIRILTPGAHPVRSHADKLRPAENPGDTLVLVDQFEEVFTLCPDPEERARFIDLLLAARERGSRLRVVLGVRADFYGRCLEHPELFRVLRDAGVPVPAMGREELREAIIKPAMARGLTVERALTAQLVQEVAGEPGGLPLLSHALLETWRRRAGRTLTLRAYEAAGGVRGAIAQTAEDLYAGLCDDQAHLVRRVLLRLIAPGEGTADTCRPVERAELHTHDHRSADAVDTVLERLADARLVTLDGDTVHLAHEALITAWPRLRGWVEEDRHRLRILRRLTEAADSWQQLGREAGALYRGARLAEAAEVFAAPDRTRELTVVERDFLDASMATRSRERRRLRGLVSTVSVLLVLALVAGAVAWQQHRTSERERLAAVARRAATAAADLRTTDPRTALRLSLAAWRLSHTPETRSALIGALAQQELPTFTPPGGQEDVDQLSQDGRTVISVGEGGLTRWDLRTHRVIDRHRLPGGENGHAGMADLSPDGRYLTVPTMDETMRLRLWDTRTHRYHGPVMGPPTDTSGSDDGSKTWNASQGAETFNSDSGDATTAVEARSWFGFSASGHALSFVDDDRLEVWSTDSGHRLFAQSSPAARESFGGDISPDNRLMALCAPGGVRVWDIRSQRRIDTAWHKRPPCRSDAELQFAPDGRTLTMLDGTGVRRLAVSTGRQLPPLRQVAPLTYAFSTDGRWVAGLGSSDILLWRLDHPQAPVFRHPVTDTQPDDLRIDTASRVLRYTTQDAEQRTVVHSLDISDALKPRWSARAVATAALSSSGAVLAVLDTRGKGASGPRVFDGHTGRQKYKVTSAGPPPTSATVVGNDSTVMSLSADGRRLAFGSGPADLMESPTRVTVWDTVRNRRITGIRPYRGDNFLAGLTLSPDGRELMTTSSDDSSVTVWNADNGKKIRTIPRRGSDENMGDYIAAVAADGSVLLTDDGTLIPTDGHGRQRALTDCSCISALSPDGSRVAFADIDGGITLWDTERGTSLGVLSGGYFKTATGDEEEPTALAFSPDGATLAAAGSHGTVRLWDVSSRQRLGTDLPTAGDGVLSLAFSPDGGTLYAAGEHVPLQHFDLDPGRLSETVCRRAGGTLSRAEWRMYLADVPYRTVC